MYEWVRKDRQQSAEFLSQQSQSVVFPIKKSRGNKSNDTSLMIINCRTTKKDISMYACMEQRLRVLKYSHGSHKFKLLQTKSNMARIHQQNQVYVQMQSIVLHKSIGEGT